MKIIIRTALFSCAALVFLAGYGAGGAADTGLTSLVPQAQARIGRPLTPVSYAGVARRTTRRAVVATSVAQPVVYAPQPAPTVVVVQPQRY